MTARIPIEAKVGAWLTAFTAIREELTPRALRADALTDWDKGSTEARQIVAANDRTAAAVAAMLVGAGGVRMIHTEEGV